MEAAKKTLQPKNRTRIKSDASTTSLGAALEKFTPEGSLTVAFASQFFLNFIEGRCNINEL